MFILNVKVGISVLEIEINFLYTCIYKHVYNTKWKLEKYRILKHLSIKHKLYHLDHQYLENYRC